MNYWIIFTQGYMVNKKVIMECLWFMNAYAYDNDVRVCMLALSVLLDSLQIRGL